MDDRTAASAALPVAEIPRSARAAFTGVRRDFRALVVRGAALELCTAGFYRFWLATAMRRHLWFHTSLDGDALEYNGRARELLIGFLFALAILMPIYFVNFLIGIEIERYKFFGSAPLFLAFYVFWQFAAYRARRYRATRTVWRGTRFWMGGSAWSYAWRAGAWTLLTVLTLGLALPWREAALERYKMKNTYYGEAAGAFAGTGWQLFKRGWWLWLILFAVIVVPLGYSGYRAYKLFPAALLFSGGLGFSYWFLGMGQAILGWIPAVFLAIAVIYPAFKARVWRWWVEGIRIGGVSFESSCRFRTLRGLYWKAAAWALLIAAVDILGIVAFFAIWRAVTGEGLANLALMSQLHPLVWIALTMGNYLVTVLCIGIVMRIYLTHDMWVRILNTTTVHNLASIENIAIKGAAADAIGEGLGDSFDVVGF